MTDKQTSIYQSRADWIFHSRSPLPAATKSMGLCPIVPGGLLVFGLDLLLLLLDQWPRRFVCQSCPHPCHFD
jgi:hypothetical protein